MDDDLLRDLEELDDEEGPGDLVDEETEENGVFSGTGTKEMTSESTMETLLASVSAAKEVGSVAKLTRSSRYQETLRKVEIAASKPKEPTYGPVEEDPEYSLIVSANNLVADIDGEIVVVHKFLRDHYAPKFPELESLLPSPLDYARIVRLIGNEMDMTNVDLKAHLPSATVMVISVTATTTNGRKLSDEELQRVFEACDMAIDLETGRKIIIDYVESRMVFMAPNLSVILGSSVAAKLMGAAGGLTALSRIPACNLLVLGAKQQKTALGLSSVSMDRHAGLMYTCDLITTTPQDVKRKAARVLSAKVALAARVDCAKESRDGHLGQSFREDIVRKIDLLLQPPPGKADKALPVPDEGPKKRRGGKKARKAKERNGITDLQKAQNRLAFGVAEQEVGYSLGETDGLGMLGQGANGSVSTGKLRIQADSRHKIGLSKKYASKSYGQSNVSGLSSSVAFTPIKGIELENPDLKKAAEESKGKDKYFSGGFFKKPAIPPPTSSSASRQQP